MNSNDNKQRRPSLPGRISAKEAGEIIDYVGLRRRKVVSEEALAAALNYVVSEASIRNHDLPPKVKRRQVLEFRKNMEALLNDVQHKLPDHGLFPPQIDGTWFNDAMRWIEETDRALSNDGSGFVGRPQVLPPHFFRAALGLYHAAFGRKPSYSYQRGDRRFGPTGRFLQACIKAVIDSDDHLKIYNKELVDRGSKDEWFQLGDESLRTKLKFFCHEKTEDTPSATPTANSSMTYQWQVHSKFFGDLFL